MMNPDNTIQTSEQSETIGCTCPFCGKQFEQRLDARRMLECTRCGYEWMSKVSNPKRCPNCGTHQWSHGNIMLECKMCGYTWNARKNGMPSKCPKCRSKLWNDGNQSKSFITVYSEPQARYTRESDMMDVLDGLNPGDKLDIGVMDYSSENDIPLLDLIRALKSKRVQYKI